jgi:Putative DNA-binding domain
LPSSLALNLHDARVLFSKQKVLELMDPATQAYRSALERHHLFPKAYLKSIGITETRDINQIANFTVVEWSDNTLISDRPPGEYLPQLEERFTTQELERMYYWHALPEQWESLPYQEFLKQRRELMAKMIRDAYKGPAGELAAEAPKAPAIQVEALVEQGENTTIEFKSTLRVNLHTGQNDAKIERAILKTIAAFLNMSGGTLVIGVTDDGDPIGIEADKFANEDKMYLHLVNLIKDRMGPSSMMYIHPHFDDYQNARVMVVDCTAGKSPVFVKRRPDRALLRSYRCSD